MNFDVVNDPHDVDGHTCIHISTATKANRPAMGSEASHP